ncbi:ANTAR domain-containing protein [Actinomycetospora sp. OC33-EN06]|uniref:ANTAR domain-containing protein n=2 Tax=Actinomycetospora aeridis TaxID=3129231 RepID=A0ABU8NAM7_9PSEU
MERFDLDQNGAFAMLREASQEAHMKLRDVAAWLAEECDTLAAQAIGTAAYARPHLDAGDDPASSPPVLRAV